jgi:hypothetical protein
MARIKVSTHGKTYCTAKPRKLGYFYLMLGLSIGLEAAIVAMITPLVFPYNLIAFIAMAAATAYLFLRNERFQN